LNEDRQPVGRVVNGFDTAAQQIIEIETDDEEQILVPLVDEFIVEVDEDQQRLICRNLKMLKDL
jgi:ribosomal 30S subunit maturation factor RimM